MCVNLFTSGANIPSFIFWHTKLAISELDLAALLEKFIEVVNSL